MDPRTREETRRLRNQQAEAPNWIFIAGTALLSVLSVRIGYKIKQAFDAKQSPNRDTNLKVNKKTPDEKASVNCHLHSNAICFRRNEDGCFNCRIGSRNVTEVAEITLPHEFNRENGVMFASSPDRLELPHKPFQHSNCSDSPCVSESGSDIFTKRDVIQKLRHQLKRRDDMILEMQEQIAQLQNSLNTEHSNTCHLQSLLDVTNREMFNENQAQKQRKAIVDHCSPTAPSRNGDDMNGENKLDKIEMLKREVRDLKEVIEGKEYLLKSYKEDKCELSMKIKELQLRLDSQLPNIL